MTDDGFSRSDQTNINALLYGSISSAGELVKNFNCSNGFHGNPLRAFKDWQSLFTPKSNKNIENIFSKLIDQSIRDSIHITKQNRLNAYVNKIENCEIYTLGDPIVHFVSNSKKYLVNMGPVECLLMERGIYITPFIWHYPRQTLKEKLRTIRRWLDNLSSD